LFFFLLRTREKERRGGGPRKRRTAIDLNYILLRSSGKERVSIPVKGLSLFSLVREEERRVGLGWQTLDRLEKGGFLLALTIRGSRWLLAERGENGRGLISEIVQVEKVLYSEKAPSKRF